MKLYCVSEWGTVSRKIYSNIHQYEQEKLDRYGHLHSYAYVREADALRKAVRNAEAKIAQIQGIKDKARARLAELGEI